MNKKQIVILCLLAVGSSFNWQHVEVLSAEAADELNGSGQIKYEATNRETVPLDPEDPEKEVDPGEDISKTTGSLRFDVIPKLDFGLQEISDKDQKYSVEAQLFKDQTTARPNYLQITDFRGSLAGWEVLVTQETYFENKEATNIILKGAYLSFDEQTIESTQQLENGPTVMKEAVVIEEVGASYSIAKAVKGKGSGTWLVVFGSSENTEEQDQTLSSITNADGTAITDIDYDNKAKFKNSAIQLFVPGATKKDPVEYKTVLTWTLSELT